MIMFKIQSGEMFKMFESVVKVTVTFVSVTYRSPGTRCFYLNFKIHSRITIQGSILFSRHTSAAGSTPH